MQAAEPKEAPSLTSVFPGKLNPFKTEAVII